MALFCRPTHGCNTVQALNDAGVDLAVDSYYTRGSFQGSVVRTSVSGDAVVFNVSPGLEVECDKVASTAFGLGDVVYVVNSSGLVTPTNPGGGGNRIGYAVPGAHGRYGGIVAGNGASTTAETKVRVRLD